MSFHNLVNTSYFSEAANDFRRNGKQYTTAPRGSRDYYDYWELHEDRCMNGYRVGDIWIPGRYYFYLNFFPMDKIADEDAAKAYFQFKKVQDQRLRGQKIDYPIITAKKDMDFARFTEVGYEWFMFKHIAWHGGEFMGIKSPGGRHQGALKSRGAGFSYSEACDGVYNYTFLDGSKSYYFAGNEDYLIKDGILNKVEPGLDFINEYILPWKKNRGKKNTLMHQKASWLDDKGVEQGVDGKISEIIGVIVDNPNKTRGKRGRKIVFEEGGSFRKLKEALEISLGSIRDGSAYVGQVAVFGTGGEEGPGIEGLEDIFGSPEAWDMLIFPNVWEAGMENEQCGYFVPCWRVNNLAIDPEGNVDMDLAIDLEGVEREKKKKSTDPKAIDRRKAEYPTNPSEALMRLTVNNFPVDLIDQQIKRLKSDRTLLGKLRHGKFLDAKDRTVEFIPDPEANPLTKYPHTRNDDLSGCITIMEPPITRKEADGVERVPGERGEMYFITVDPVQLEDAEDLTSLWAIYVWKLPNLYSSTNTSVPVAWFVGRPKQLETAWKIIFDLAKYYNALVQSEIAGGGQAIYTYAKNSVGKYLLEYIAFELGLDTKEVDATELKRNRSYFMNMPTKVKEEGLKALVDWCTQIYGLDESGDHIINLHNVLDVGFLMEMKKFRNGRNADRVSQAILAMYMLNKGIQIYDQIKQTEEKVNKVSFFNRPKFVDSQSTGEYASMY